jgi:hypothetical protein
MHTFIDSIKQTKDKYIEQLTNNLKLFKTIIPDGKRKMKRFGKME